MNIVFWLIVVLGAFAIWWLLSPLFEEIGEWFKNEADDLKTEIKDEWEEDNK